MEPRQVRRIGLIGVGKHGARYARHIRDEAPDLELAAIARRDADKAAASARELGARAYTDYRELIERGGVDALIVVVPPTLHVDIVRCAARAGVPVLLEKPAAPSLAAGREHAAPCCARTRFRSWWRRRCATTPWCAPSLAARDQHRPVALAHLHAALRAVAARLARRPGAVGRRHRAAHRRARLRSACGC